MKNKMKKIGNKNLKKRKEQGAALFEIFLMVISIGTFAYFIGDAFGFVSAYLGGDTGNCASMGGEPCAPGTGTCESGGSIQKSSDTDYCCTGTCKPADEGGILGSVTDKASDVGTAMLISKASQLPTPTDVTGLTHTPVTAEEMAKATEGLSKIAPKVTPGLEWGKLEWGVKNGWFTILANAAIAVGLYFVTKGIGGLFFPDSPKLFGYLAVGASVGYASGAALGILISVLGGGGNSLPIFGLVGMGWGLIGMGLGLLIAGIVYKEEKIVSVQFSCLPWQPEKGGAKCNECNKGDFGCTPYKCQSLGLSCELLNPNTDRQVCYWVNRNNISPPTISAWDGPLDSEKYEYVPDTARLPPDKGVIIKDKRTADGCIVPFSRVDFGVTLDIPGACRVDIQRKSNYSDMTNPGYISQGYYVYNHTMVVVPSGLNTSDPYDITIQTGGTYEIFVRCESKQGYSNPGTFVFKYCVKKGPDITAPFISAADPVSGMPFQFGQTSKKVYIYVDKPSECRWSHKDEDFDIMPEIMTGPRDISGIDSNMKYAYQATLTGLKDGVENLFYFRCKSYPNKDANDRYKNEQSFPYKLIGTRLLVFDSLTPEVGEIIKDATESVKVTLEAKTSAGYKDGEAKCYYKETSDDGPYVEFYPGLGYSYQNSQDLWFEKGEYDYSVQCCDLGGNCETKTTQFEVDTDFQSSIVVRAYNEAGSLKIVTDESAECVYDKTSCSYNFDDGLKMTTTNNIDHFTEWDTNNNFYIKCKDSFGNQPAPDACSITIRPFTSY
ncbi:hypothetical protein A3K64_01730 [Candidatus Micrarchaeota archaeon RBG_16_36_9]|nr:MAG: hypothetical protein A3K64_01730 [Candidatus Micrarchaeota archaeon RBG_16_36_9]